MDKETLSNYGWIVICVLVLAVMLALATPFGTFVAGAVKSTTAGLFGVNQNALGAAGIEIGDQAFANCEHLETEIRNATADYSGDTCCKECGTVLSTGIYVIPEGGKYIAADGTVYNPGDGFPEAVTTGDQYTYGDYQYRYNQYHFGSWTTDTTQNGWGVRVIDQTKTTYGPILESINGEAITSLRSTFTNCGITSAPAIPSGVTNMYCAFQSCKKLTDISNIVIPDGVTNMDLAFQDCKSLKDASTLLIPSAVTKMQQTFNGCTNLEDAPIIPSNVSNVNFLFQGCTSLTGTVTINTNAYVYHTFSGVDFETQNINLAGTSTKLDEYGATGTNYCAECNGKCQGNH